MLSMLGFMVCPPEMMWSVDRALNTSSTPAPQLTEMRANSFSFRLRWAASCLFCSRMFSILMRSNSP